MKKLAFIVASALLIIGTAAFATNKCGAGKCGSSMKEKSVMKCGAGKCGNAKKTHKKKCGAGKCGSAEKKEKKKAMK